MPITLENEMKPPKLETLQKEIDRATALGLTAEIKAKAGLGYRTKVAGHDSNYSPPQPLVIDGKNMSLAQARQFLGARERLTGKDAH
jgi:hypothetical protein